MVKTYSPEEVAAMFQPDGSSWWLREGIRQGRFPHLKVGRHIRLTDEHIAEIAAAIERRGTPKQKPRAVDVSVFQPSRRSKAHRRTA